MTSEEVKLKRLFRIVNGSTPRSDTPSYWNGDIVWVTPDDLGRLSSHAIHTSGRTLTAQGLANCGASLVPPGSLILSTRAPIGHLGLAAVDLAINQGCRALVPRDGVDSSFYYYALVACRPELNARGTGSTFLELSRDQLGEVPVPAPSLPTQRAIATFLDRETAKIDTLIEKKRRLLDLLDEKRTALITRTVTRGLDPDVPMKDSGVEWLGEIPAHWGVAKLKLLVPDVSVGIVVKPSQYYVDEGVPCLRSLNISSGEVDLAELVFISDSANALLAKSQVHSGDIVVVRTGKAGTAAVIPDELEGCNCIDLLIVRRANEMSSEFVRYYLNSWAAISQAEKQSVGAIQAHYNTSTLKDLLVPDIPLEEQQAIVEYLNQAVGDLDSIVEGCSHAISLLQEYRTALISAAVTGQIEIPETAA